MDSNLNENGLPNSDESNSNLEFERYLKKFGPMLGKGGSSKPGTMPFTKTKNPNGEEVYRGCSLVQNGLPILPDCKSFYSGNFNGTHWLQNAQQVVVFVPIVKEMTKSDIDVQFGINGFDIFFHGNLYWHCDVRERIISGGCFWSLEVDNLDDKYIYLDLEKRILMINWKSLFKKTPEEQAEDDIRKESLMGKLFDANKGVSELSGYSPLSIEEMERNPEIMSSISNPVESEPQIIDVIGEKPSEEELKEMQEEVSAKMKNLTFQEFKEHIRQQNEDATNDADETSSSNDSQLQSEKENEV